MHQSHLFEMIEEENENSLGMAVEGVAGYREVLE